MIGVIAAYTNRKVTDADNDDYQARYLDTTDSTDDNRRTLIDNVCSENYRYMFD